MLIAHLSDLHLYAHRPETAHTRPDITSRVRQIVADLTELRPLPDLVLISGDVTDGGSEDDYALARSILEKLPMPFLLVPGNHDRRDTMRAVFSDRLDFAPGEYLNFRVSAAGGMIIGLDTTIPGRVEGALCQTRLEWLAKALAGVDRPTFVTMHHPPFSTGQKQWDRTNLTAGGAELAALIEQAPGQVRLLCGHVHQPIHTIWHGAYAAIAGSPAFEYALDIGGSAEPPLAASTYTYWLHHQRPDATFSVHPRQVNLECIG